MNDITINVFPARNGDSFLISLKNKKNILVDMGYKDTYKAFIKDKLIELKELGQCIDLLIITHTDRDHIEGAIEFFKENGHVKNQKIIEVKEIWYNSYRHLQFMKPKVKKIKREEALILENICLNDTYQDKYINENNNISAMHGSTLASYLYVGGYFDEIWNKSFDLQAVSLDNKSEVELCDGIFEIISPNNKKLEILSKLWLRELRNSKLNFDLSDEKIFDDAYEVYLKNLNENIVYEEESPVSNKSKKNNSIKEIIEQRIIQPIRDKSKSNGASIAFIMKYEDIKIMFLGDAHEDVIIERIEKYSDVDFIKISHHGSLKNNYKWIEKINAKGYLFSTDGQRHNHPDAEVLAKILIENKQNKQFYFNYNVCIVDELKKNDLTQNYHYEIFVGEEDKILKIQL